MYQRTRIILDCIAAIAVYSLVLLIIPVSDKFLAHLNEDTVDAVLNLVINTLIGLVFIFLLFFLIRRGRRGSLSSYTWLLFFLFASVFFLAQVQVTRDRLHFLGYGILSLFLYRALKHYIGTQMLYVWSSLFIMVFALLDETLQMSGLGGRSFSWQDVGIDCLSSLIGQCVIARVIRPKLESVNIRLRRYAKGLKEIKAFAQKHG